MTASIRTGGAAERESIWRGGTSADVIAALFDAIPGDPTVLDLTWGTGAFWRWDWRGRGITLSASDLYAPTPSSTAPNTPDFFARMDFTDLPDHAPWHHADVVVFDPPFTAQGPNRKAEHRHNDRYRATRDLNGAPKNIHDVHRLLEAGIRSACAIADQQVIVKTQDVVESGILHASVNLALNTIAKCGFQIVQQVRFHPNRRAQPSGRRVTGLGSQPSVFIRATRGQLPLALGAEA